MIAPFCITLDCDSLTEHHAVWGLPPPSKTEVESFFLRSLEQAFQWLQDRHLKATFFITGGRLTEPVWRLLLRIAGEGHELANHTLSHPYDLGRLSADAVFDEIRKNHELILARGLRCRGLRTPGYHLPPQALPALDQLDYLYSSSQITGWVYPTAKWVTALSLRLRGRTTKTVMHPVSDWWTPPEPYHPDPATPGRAGSARIWEIPIGAGRWGLPTVGPLIHACPLPALFDTPVSRPWVMNLHLTDFTPDTPHGDLARVDFMLRIPAARRLTALDRILDRARAQGRPFETMAAFAARLNET